jgi:glycosyltransferase involved in cell wall biosynthesis
LLPQSSFNLGKDRPQSTMISVCIACYNGEKFIREQIISILGQLSENDEIIVSDDSSSDNTVEIIKSIADPRINLVFNKNSTGRPTENFQNALLLAKGDLVFLADQDDIWVDNKCAKLTSLLGSCLLVLSDSIVVDENLNELNSSFFKFHGSGKGVLRNIVKNSYFGSCMAFRRELLEFALPFPSSREIGHDVWLGLVAEMVGKVCLTHERLILYRRHDATVTPHAIGKSKRSLPIKLWGRVIMLKYVLVFYFKYLINGKRISIHYNTHV